MTAKSHQARLRGVAKRSLTVEEQCQAAADYFAYLEAKRDGDLPIVDCFNDAWDYLSELYSMGDECVIKRGAESAKVAGAPLAALFFHVEMGFYPPPELLVALKKAWEYYKYGDGDVSLEEAFFGKPKNKAGNFAKRARSRQRMLSMKMDMSAHVRSGMTRIQAAELIAEKSGAAIDPESIARTVKPFSTKNRKK